MAAPKGNQFWLARSRHGRKPIFESPQMLWEGCLDYFQWIEDNPLYETKVFAYQGAVDKENGFVEVPKMRAMTLSGLCIFLDISMETWTLYKQREDFIGVCSEAEQIIYNQKFQGAAADFLNANIIARDLGLKDQQETKHTGTISLTEMSQEELDRRIKHLESLREKNLSE